MTGPVRPYVITGGRSRSGRTALAVESLVCTVDTATDRDRVTLNREHRAILTLCQEMFSVAEIAAHLRLPISVVKVLLGDLQELGAVKVLPPVPQAERLPAALLEEVLVGLRQLR